MTVLRLTRSTFSVKLACRLLAGMLLLQSCASERFSSSPTPTNLIAANVAPTTVRPPEYTFTVGDELDIKLYYHPELNETARIRPDGKISLQLVGDVDAVDRTPASLSQHLHTQYRTAGLRNPVVTIMLRKSAGQRVFVGGEVATPKMIPYEGRLSLSQALFEAGGLKPSAQKTTILLLRDDNQGKPLVMTVSLDEIFDQPQDVALHPYDVVFVPKSPIARVNEFVDQYIVKVLPISLSGGFSYLLGGTISAD